MIWLLQCRFTPTPSITSPKMGRERWGSGGQWGAVLGCLSLPITIIKQFFFLHIQEDNHPCSFSHFEFRRSLTISEFLLN